MTTNASTGAPAAPRASSPDETRARIRQALLDAKRVAVGTHAGDEVRVRMMHPGAWLPSDPTGKPIVYLASMKSDPKITEMSARPEVALLMHESPTGEEGSSWEMEITGRAEIVRDPAEREIAKEATKRTSSIVQYLDSVGQTDVLAYVRVTPRFMKHRVFGEIVAGRPPSILEFPLDQRATSDWALLRSRVRVWKELVRWPSLTASAASVGLGLAVAFAIAGTVQWGAALLTLVAAVALQACTNIKNDLDDTASGADDRNRTPILGFTGGSRVIQRGLATRADLVVAMLLFGLLSTAAGIYFALAGRPLVILWGVLGLLIGFIYTGPPVKLANRGLGELAVALAFGVGIVTGTTYVQLGFVPAVAWVASVPVSILVALILFMNGFQDAESDAQVTKRTMVVRLGLERAARTYPLFAAAAAITLLVPIAMGVLPPAALLGLAGFPLFARAAKVAREKFAAPFELVPANAYTAVGHLASTLMLAVGLAWAGAAADGRATAAALGATAVGVAVILYYNRSISRLARAFYGVRDAVAQR